jgi:hypothetical protein
MGVIMDMDNYDGHMVALLISGEYEDKAVDSVHPDGDAAAHYLGSELLSEHPNGVGKGPWSLEWVPAPELEPTGQDVPTPAAEPEIGASDVDAVAGVLQRHALGGELGSAMAAREVVKVMAQRMADARSMAAQDVEANRRALVAQLRDALSGEPVADQADDLGALVGVVRGLAWQAAARRRGAPSPWPADARHASAEGLDRMARELRVLEGGGMRPWSEYSTAERAPYLSRARQVLNAYAGRLPSPTQAQAIAAFRAFELQADHEWDDADRDVQDHYLAQARANWR